MFAAHQSIKSAHQTGQRRGSRRGPQSLCKEAPDGAGRSQVAQPARPTGDFNGVARASNRGQKQQERDRDRAGDADRERDQPYQQPGEIDRHRGRNRNGFAHADTLDRDDSRDLERLHDEGNRDQDADVKVGCAKSQGIRGQKAPRHQAVNGRGGKGAKGQGPQAPVEQILGLQIFR